MFSYRIFMNKKNHKRENQPEGTRAQSKSERRQSAIHTSRGKPDPNDNCLRVILCFHQKHPWASTLTQVKGQFTELGRSSRNPSDKLAPFRHTRNTIPVLQAQLKLTECYRAKARKLKHDIRREH